MNSHFKAFAALAVLCISVFIVSPRPQEAQTKRRARAGARRPATPREITPREIATLVYPATVSIYTLTNGKEVFTGSGFFISPSRIATCYHVIEDARVILIRLPDARRPSAGRSSMGDAEGTVAAAIYRTDPERDLAILSIDRPVGKPLKLFMGTDMYVGETVYTVGDPKGIAGTFSSGMTSNFLQYEDQSMAIQFTAPVSPGSSGGALVNSKGEVIGIVNEQLREGQNLNFAIPAAYLRALVLGVPALSPDDYLDGNMNAPVPPKRRP